MAVSVLVTAIVAFAGTAVDDMVILAALFFARGATGRPLAVSIVVGQYLGFIAIVAAAGLAAGGLLILPDRWIGLLGLVPIASVCGAYGATAPT
jgi:cadmium resistance protein CadD (predicted permease)